MASDRLPNSARRAGRGGRGRPAQPALGVVRVDPDFEIEYPGADASCTEAYASLVRTGESLLAEIGRSIEVTFDVAHPVITALAVIDGAGEMLTPSQIGDRVLVSGATMTSTLDVLEDRGWIRRIPNPADRRSVLIEITAAGRSTIDQALPGIRTIERSVLSVLTESERRSLLKMLTQVLARAAEVAAQPPQVLTGSRVRPTRLTTDAKKSH